MFENTKYNDLINTCNLPECNEGITIFATDDVHSAVRNAEALEKAPNIGGVRRPRQILQPYDYAHVLCCLLRYIYFVNWHFFSFLRSFYCVRGRLLGIMTTSMPRNVWIEDYRLYAYIHLIGDCVFVYMFLIWGLEAKKERTYKQYCLCRSTTLHYIRIGQKGVWL